MGSFVFAEDYACPDGKSKKSITIKKDQSFNFDIAPGYGPKTKCGVVYKPQRKGKTKCKKIKFSCATFDLPNKSGPPKCKKGDKVKVGKQFFCKTKSPDVESTKPIKLMFLSDKKDSSGAATCTIMCADTATAPPPTTTTVLDRVSLAAYPLAQCNNGNPAVYYKPKEPTGPKKALIYLQGGGVCFPSDEGSRNCDKRCENKPYQCAAKNDTTIDLRENKFYNSIFNEGQDRNPAFYDFAKIYVPYCTSVLHSGTREASSATKGGVFYGKHVVEAVIDDLIANSWIKEAEKVVMIGTSAG